MLKNCSLDVKHQSINQLKRKQIVALSNYILRAKQKNRTKIDIVILFRTLGLFCVYIVCQHFLMLVVFYIVDLCK